MNAQQARLYHRLQLAAHRAQRAADRALTEAAGVTTAQAAVLVVVAADGSPTQRSVADQLGLHESAVTQMVGRLLRLGLIERRRDPADGRARLLSLTADGRDAVRRLRGPFAAVNAAMDEALDGADVDRLAADLGRIADAFAGG